MPKIKVNLSIGFSGAEHDDIIEIDKDEWDDCSNEDEREGLMRSYWVDWSNNYIDGYYELIED